MRLSENCHSVLDTESRLVRQRWMLDSRFRGNDDFYYKPVTLGVEGLKGRVINITKTKIDYLVLFPLSLIVVQTQILHSASEDHISSVRQCVYA